MNAIIYGAGIGHDGDLLEKDLSGKGAYRSSQAADFDDLRRETDPDTPFDDDEVDGIAKDKEFNEYGQGKPLFNADQSY